jgi:hypothetical protein
MADDFDDSFETDTYVGYCRWKGCDQDATTVLTRLANKEEQDDGCIARENGVRVPLSFEFPVCDTHLSQAQRLIHLESLSDPELLQSWNCFRRASTHNTFDFEQWFPPGCPS